MNAFDTLDVREAAEYLKCSVGTVRTQAKAGKLPCGKIGKNYVFLRSELANLLKGKKSANEEGKQCQSTSAKVVPITTTGSNTKGALTVLQQAQQAAKKRNR